ncbi:hypothetical protein AZE42_11188 [Rhizopogon vesiculosus]|uniref:Uncharacterized protein n=1 Tax=Rhizopogon vesiculosus TaxID=180088 RepID=A0A1J8PZX8_9AGAM|nr:hypothetical protein AZE42_11188 [Rhizopogon vesiculosus]
MPPQSSRQRVVIPIDIGSPARYDPSIFPLMKVKGRSPSLHDVEFVLEATLDEIFRMRHLAGDRVKLRQLMVEAKDRYDLLNSQKEKLENSKKSMNPIKFFSTYRSIRLLADAGQALWYQTRTVSERMRRELLSVNEEDLQSVNYEDLPPGARISGIAVSTEAETRLDDDSTFFSEAASYIASQLDLLPDGNPFADSFEVEDLTPSAVHEQSSTTNDATDDDVTSSTSSRPSLSGTSFPSSQSSRQSSGNIFIFNNSYVASRSAIQTPTLNNGGSNNRGSCS